jgi:plasmid maintenance system killer protein
MTRCRNWIAREVSLCDYAFIQEGPRTARWLTKNIRQEGIRDFQSRSVRSAIADPQDSSIVGETRTVYSVWVEKDLRTLFYLEKDMVVTIDIGSHRMYRD